MAKLTGEPAKAKEISERAKIVPDSGFYQSYCLDPKNPVNLGKISSAKIKIFQRSGTETPRNIVNIQVKKILFTIL